MMNNDLVFLSGEFFDWEIPKEKRYLLKYFKTDLEFQFLKYYICFGQFENFTDHTGLFCQVRWLRLLEKKLNTLTKAHAAAKFDMDLELLAKIETGKYHLTGKVDKCPE